MAYKNASIIDCQAGKVKCPADKDGPARAFDPGRPFC